MGRQGQIMWHEFNFNSMMSYSSESKLLFAIFLIELFDFAPYKSSLSH